METTARLWQYYTDGPADNITDSKPFNFKSELLDNINNASTLKYLSNFWTTLEVPLINFKIIFILTWPPSFVICEDDRQNNFCIN